MANKKSSTSDIKNLANYTALNMMSLSSEILGQTIDLAPVVTIPSGTRILVRIPTSINMN